MTNTRSANLNSDYIELELNIQEHHSKVQHHLLIYSVSLHTLLNLQEMQ